MDYTNDILEILSSELEPYVSHGGEACIDGVLTSAQKLNEFLQQKLHKTPCSTLREALVQKMNEVQKQSDEVEKRDSDEECIADTYKNYKQGMAYALSLIDELHPPVA